MLMIDSISSYFQKPILHFIQLLPQYGDMHVLKIGIKHAIKKVEVICKNPTTATCKSDLLPSNLSL